MYTNKTTGTKVKIVKVVERHKKDSLIQVEYLPSGQTSWFDEKDFLKTFKLN